MDTYEKTEMVEAEQWNKLGDVKEAGVQKYEETNDGWIPVSDGVSPSNRVRPGDYIVRAYDIKTDGTIYYPISKEDFENLWMKVNKPEWEGDGDAYVSA